MNKTTGFLLAFAVILIILAIVVARSGNGQQPDVRNRVPTLPQSTAEAQQAATDAKAAAAQAVQAQKDIQAQLAQLAEDNKKEQEAAKAKPASAPAAPYGKEITNPGVVTDFGAFPLIVNSQTDDVYLGFTFTDRTGFTKKFFPVCVGQTLKTGTPITIIYHWRDWQSETTSKRGCYEIDGFQQ
jgi:hypothetical protein